MLARSLEALLEVSLVWSSLPALSGSSSDEGDEEWGGTTLLRLKTSILLTRNTILSSQSRQTPIVERRKWMHHTKCKNCQSETNLRNLHLDKFMNWIAVAGQTDDERHIEM